MSKEPDHKMTYQTHLSDGASSMAQPVSPPQISRTTEVTDNITNPFVQVVTMPFHSAHSSSISRNKKEPNHNLLETLSNCGQKTWVGGNRRNLADHLAKHNVIHAGAKSILSGDAHKNEQWVRDGHFRNSSNNNLYNPRY
jgi:hypothetical protein